jgi:CRISPR-associated endonuclease/helicase Cas3
VVKIGLLHSRFPFYRRAELEEEWLERLGKQRAEELGSILVATQVVEQSVDIDLDFIVSDLAPTDMLLQRVGRLWRHERSSRLATKAVFWVRIPETKYAAAAADLRRVLGRSARVYSPYVLVRTAEVWGTRRTLVLPRDIRMLLEETYAEQELDDSPGRLELQQELEKEKAHLAAFAEAATRVLGHPALKDVDEVLTRRKGPPTRNLLLVKSIVSGSHRSVTLLPLTGGRIQISEVDWRRSSARFIHTWTVRVPKWMVPQTASSPNWLSLHGPEGCVVAEVGNDGTCVFNGDAAPMRYTPDLGIFAEGASRIVSQPQWNDDDEFDY